MNISGLRGGGYAPAFVQRPARPALAVADRRTQGGGPLRHGTPSWALPEHAAQSSTERQAVLDEIARLGERLGVLETGLVQQAARPGDEPPGRTIVVEHGNFDPDTLQDDGQALDVVVPDGTTLVLYALHGGVIDLALIKHIGSGGSTDGLYRRTLGPGERVPNYTIIATPDFVEQPMLDPYEEAHLMRDEDAGSWQEASAADRDRVLLPRSDTHLSQVLEPGMGECHWVTCLAVEGHPNIDLMTTRRGLVDLQTGQAVDAATLARLSNDSGGN